MTWLFSPDRPRQLATILSHTRGKRAPPRARKVKPPFTIWVGPKFSDSPTALFSFMFSSCRQRLLFPAPPNTAGMWLFSGVYKPKLLRLPFHGRLRTDASTVWGLGVGSSNQKTKGQESKPRIKTKHQSLSEIPACVANFFQKSNSVATCCLNAATVLPAGVRSTLANSFFASG